MAANQVEVMGANVRMEAYEGFLDWLVTFRNPFGENGAFWNEPTFFSNECEFYLLAILTFYHAWTHGGRYVWLWLAILWHGFTVELVSYWLEDIDSFWHAQATFMFFGQREPLQIVLVYPSYLYICAVAVERLRVPELCQGPTLALLVILLDIPYDVMGIKLLWWTWHDTDSNIRDRHYWVPWTSYYFHMTFACAFTLIYNKMRRHMTGLSGTYSEDDLNRMSFAEQRKAANFRGEFVAMACAGMFAMPFGICQFVPGYHWGHDIFNLHAEFSTLFLAAIYLSVAVYGLLHRRPANVVEEGEREAGRGDKRRGSGRWHIDTVYLAMLAHFSHYCLLVLFAHPETYQVYGLHQPMGSAPGSTDGFACDQTVNLTYPYPFTPAQSLLPLLGDVLPVLFDDVTVWKRPYLCENELLLDEGVFGFHCEKARQQKWEPGNQMFYICGTDFTNKDSGTTRVEYAIMIIGCSLLAVNAFTMFMYYPRTLFSQVFFYCEFPRYYKADKPSKILVAVEQARVNAQGRQEFLVRRADRPTLWQKWTGDLNTREETSWELETELVLDAVGQLYGSASEGYGLYGVMPEAHCGSTRDRLRTFKQRQHALDRLSLHEACSKRKTKPGISYDRAVPRSRSKS